MTTAIPEISPALRQWTASVAENNAAFVDRVYKALMIVKPWLDLEARHRAQAAERAHMTATDEQAAVHALPEA
ncbi:hypothetical protein [Burkholderia aenigmatica]|uniref:Uncharacterized protein n=1 Tax=Burkholderia aenigmatica TaxID=2015348 RepID=A0A228I1H3_9BURK|nr:hypothetical protein [Burkholderia aenigmatica]OXI35929.1 hypothetical protein CFB84_36685 [Burkholderia aenigmatica]